MVDLPAGVALADTHTFPPSHCTSAVEELHTELLDRAGPAPYTCCLAGDNPAQEPNYDQDCSLEEA